MPTILFAAPPRYWGQYELPLRAALAGAGVQDATLTCDAAAEAVDYMIYAPCDGAAADFTPYTRLKAVLGLWAGIETVVGNPTLTVPLTRMVDPGLTEGMIEWVVGHTLRYHLGMDAHIKGQDGTWRNGVVPPLARNRVVAVLGLGVLGAASARALAGLNFRVLGWSRQPKEIEGVVTTSGPKGLQPVLSKAELTVLLLPCTPRTENTLNRKTLAMMPKGGIILNPGRGPLIDDNALLEALDSGQISHATLDTFRIEPLPKEHPFWVHPGVTVTPHIASETRPDSAARVIAENIRRGEAGEPFLHLVDRTAGY
ncbi:MAG: glyoxylate/hydroxypyruvate reductase A [Rhodobacteraceae bacterium]|nr:glyoxylate/hydroxypyruvate reductase A [Paracoccaceae bacterium]